MYCRYKRLVAVFVKKHEIMLGKYSGGWKFQCNALKCSDPAFLFQFVRRWKTGVVHGEGTFEFICEYRMFLGVAEGDTYRGSWENNFPHGQGLLIWSHGYSYLRGNIFQRSHDWERHLSVWS